MKTISAKTTDQKVIRYYEEAGLDYGAWSKNYNMHFGWFSPGENPFNLESLLERMNREVMNRLHIPKEKDAFILDVGCGLAAASRYMAKQMPNAEFYGITITPWQIDFGGELNAEAGLANRISLLNADFQDMPIPANYADGAFALESACYARGNDKGELLKEVARVLKPGARFVVADGFRRHSRPLPGWLDRIYRRNLECWALTEFADIQLFVKAMQAAGFKNIVVEDVSWHVAPSFLHIPKTAIKFFWERLWDKDAEPLTKERRNNVLAPLLGMIMGLCRRHFTYCLVSGEK